MLLTHQFSIINDQDQSQYQHIGQHRQQRPAPLLFEYEPTSIVENRRTPHQSLTIPSSGPDIESSELERGVNRSTIRQTERQRGFEVVGIEELPSAIDAAWVDQSQEHSSELMQSDPWYFAGHFDARSATGRFSHQRESSLSSLGSIGPASPYTQNTTNPHIAIHDSNSDGFSDLPSHDNTYYQLGKAKGSKDALYADYHATGVDGPVPDLAFSSHSIGMRNECCGRGSLPTRDMPATAVHGHGRSNPTSVASSVADDSPATPSMGEPDYVPRRRPATFASVPKLDRTMTDVYGDELYNPNFTITSASPMAIPISPSNDVFAQRLHAANHQHLSAAQSPISTSSRSRSPFTQGSPLAPARGSDFGSSSSTVSRHKTGSTSIGGERESSTADVVVMRNGQRAPVQSEAETPKTISPQDALLEFNDSEGDANFPLFSPEETTLFGRPGPDRVPADLFEHHGLPSSAGASDDDRSITYGLSQFPNDIRIPQQYPFIAQAHAPRKAMHQGHSVESTSSESLTSQRNSKEFMAEVGTYSCTYHGCTLLFDTPALLQKHKREGHRQAQGISAGRRPESLVAASMMTQAGPHKCDRINPSTGKPCNTIFSRPYDLTRHEDTIHNARKQKVRCGLCTEEKTFSRADALTRHFRVCHPDVEFPAKHRRRIAHG